MNLGPDCVAGKLSADEILCRKIGSAERPVSELHVTGQISTHSIGSVLAPVKTIHMASDFVIQDHLKFVETEGGTQVASIGTDGHIHATKSVGIGTDLVLRRSSAGRLSVDGQGDVVTGISATLTNSATEVPSCAAVRSIVDLNTSTAVANSAAIIALQNAAGTADAYTKSESDARYLQSGALGPCVTISAAQNDFLGIDAIASKFAFQSAITVGDVAYSQPYVAETEFGTAVNVLSSFAEWQSDETGSQRVRARTSLVSPQWVLEKDVALRAVQDSVFASLAEQNALTSRVDLNTSTAVANSAAIIALQNAAGTDAYTKSESDARYLQSGALSPYATTSAVQNDFLGIDAIASKFAFQSAITVGDVAYSQPYVAETEFGTAVNVLSSFAEWQSDETGSQRVRARTSLVSPQWVLEKDVALRAVQDSVFASLAEQNALTSRVGTLEASGFDVSPATINGETVTALYETSTGNVHVYQELQPWNDDAYFYPTPESVLKSRTSLVTPHWVIELNEAVSLTNDTKYAVKATEARVDALEENVSTGDTVVLAATKGVELAVDGSAMLVVNQNGIFRQDASVVGNEMMSRSDVEVSLGTYRIQSDLDALNTRVTTLESGSGMSAAQVDAAIAAAIAPYIATPVWTDAPLEPGLTSHPNWIQVTFTRIQHGAAFMVKMRGLVQNSGAFSSNGMLLFTLPTGYRPAGQHSFHVQMHVGDRSGRIDVQVDGSVKLSPQHDDGAGFVNLSQVEFFTN